MARIFSINCNGLRGTNRVEFLKDKINKFRIDICFIQETYIGNVKAAKLIESKLGGKVYWSFTNNRGKGVGIFIRRDFECAVNKFYSDMLGRFIYVDVNIDGFDFRLVNVYAPNVPRERKDFFNELYGVLLCSKEIVLGGDFNCVGNLRLDKMGGNRERGKDGWDELSCLVKDFDLVDSFRHLFPGKKEYTWSSRGVSCRLDRIYVSRKIVSSIKDVRHILFSLSDHNFVACFFENFHHIKIGSSYWKFNNSLVDDQDFVDYMSLYLKFALETRPVDFSLLQWWDECKVAIKNKCIWFSKMKGKREGLELKELRRDYFALVKQGSDERARDIKAKILGIESDKLKGAQIRAKARDLTEGEKPSKFFFRKELKRGQKKTINKIIDIEGKEQTTSEGILGAFRDFYQNLFQKEDVDGEVVEDMLRDLPQVGEEDREFLGDDIQREEIRRALNEMESEKSPGCDGLTKEFYKCFFEILAPLFSEMFQIIHDNECLSNSQKMSYISLICKDPQNPDVLKNYRPISLLNIDYKLLTKVLCNRLKLVMDKVVHSDQTCGVPGRSILDSCHLVRDIIDFANSRDIPSLFLSLDQEKAFDRVSHEFLFRVLEAFGLGEGFIGWIRAIYSNISSSVIVNGFVSKAFSVGRSVRQGCSLSPLLYVLCLEPVLKKIREDSLIKGFKIPGRIEQKTSAFADDSNFTLLDDLSAKRVIGWFDYYGRGSGSKLSRQKCKGMFMGRWRERRDRPLGIEWVSKLKVFGVWVGNVKSCDIWEPVLNKIRNTLQLYSGRVMSVYGRAIVVNVMVLSKLWYLASVVVLPEKYIVQIEKLVFDFFWSSKMELVRRKTMYLAKEEGGIGVVNIRAKVGSLQLVQAAKVMFDTGELAWVGFGHIWLGLALIKYGSYSFSNSVPHCVEDVPGFYGSVLALLNVLYKDKSVDFRFVQGQTCKGYYNVLVNRQKETPRVTSVFPQLDFQEIFKNLTNKILDPVVLDVSFKICHDVLPVAYRLHCFQMSVAKECSFCGRDIETIEHLFYYCPFVQQSKMFLADWFREILEQGMSLEAIRFSVFRGRVRKEERDVMLMLLSEYRYAVWMCRNRCRFDNKVSRVKDVTVAFLARIRVRLMVEFARMSEVAFVVKWGFPSLCTVQNGMLQFSFGIG